MMQTPLRGCLIGAGFFAGHQMEAWRRIPEARIVAVIDSDIQKARAFARTHAVPQSFTSLEEMCADLDVDFVDIATRPPSHLPLIRQAADRGKAILCQKPFTRTRAEAEEAVRYCRAHGVRLMVNENWRWQVWYREIKRLLELGAVGEVHHVRFVVRPGDGSGPEPYAVQPYFRQMPRFLIHETLVHFLDTLEFLAGPIERLYCRTRRLNPHIAGEDFALAVMDLQSGATAAIDANRYAGERTSKTFGFMAVEGSEGAVHLDHDGTIRRIDLCGERTVHPYTVPSVGYRGDSCFGAQRHFVQSLVADAPFETSGEAYLRTLAAVEACYRSAGSGEPVRLSR